MADPPQMERTHLRRPRLPLLPLHHGSRHPPRSQQKQTRPPQKHHQSAGPLPDRSAPRLHHRLRSAHRYPTPYPVRIMGILQRLSLCYGINLFVHWATDYGANVRARIVAACVSAVSVILYVILMLTWSDEGIGCFRDNNLDPYCNFAGYLDRAIFTQKHIMEYTDP